MLRWWCGAEGQRISNAFAEYAIWTSRQRATAAPAERSLGLILFVNELRLFLSIFIVFWHMLVSHFSRSFKDAGWSRQPQSSLA
jgi:hypothetical protein